VSSASTLIGVPAVDRRMAPVPKGSSVVFVNDPGVDATPFLYQAAREHVARGGPVVFVGLDRPPNAVAMRLRAFGLDARAPKLVIVDGYSSGLGLDFGARHVIPDPYDPASLAMEIERLSTLYPNAFLAVDSLSTLVDRAADPERAARDLPRIVAAFRRFPVSATVVTAWPYEGGTAPFTSAFDGVVQVSGLQGRRATTGHAFRVERAGWRANGSDEAVAFVVREPEGVLEYIPKILVTGPFHAGKSTFVNAVSDTSISVNRLDTTVALDHGTVTMDGFTTEVFGTPGQARFDPLLGMLAGQAMGVVLVVESSRHYSLKRARAMLEESGTQHLPIVVAANRQDPSNALSPEEIARELALGDDVPVVPIDVSDPIACRALLRRLFRNVRGVVT
jgi:uncharacterized protein